MKPKGISRTFQGIFEQIQGHSVPKIRQKALLFCSIISAMSFTRFASGKKSTSVFVFEHCYIEGIMSGYDKQLISTIFLHLKMNNFAHSRIFKYHKPNSRTFEGLEFPFANSRIFKDRATLINCYPGLCQKYANTLFEQMV